MNKLKTAIKNTWNFLKVEIPELLGNWRFIPRLLMFMYCYAFYAVTTWFMNIADPTTAQAGFVSVVVGAGAGFFGIYCGTGGIKKDKKEIK